MILTAHALIPHYINNSRFLLCKIKSFNSTYDALKPVEFVLGFLDALYNHEKTLFLFKEP